MKVKLFTHTDLDGVGCAVVAAHAFGKKNVDVTYCDYDNINEMVGKFIYGNQYSSYNLVLITDISVNEAIAEDIDSLNDKHAICKFILLDHHATADWLNKYYWATVTPVKVCENDRNGPDMFTSETEKTSGTSMLYDYCVNHKYLNWNHFPYNLKEFVETVRRWDTWDWINVYGGEETPKTLNSYLYLIGRDRFFNRFADKASIEFSDGEKLVLELEADRIKNYILMVSRNVRKLEVAGYKIGLVFAEQYQSELGNAIASENPDIDFAVIVNLGGGTVSLRGNKEHIDLGEFSSRFGGGGHKFASGLRIRPELNTANLLSTLIFGVEEIEKSKAM